MAQSLVSRCTGCAGGVAEMESTNNDLGGLSDSETIARRAVRRDSTELLRFSPQERRAVSQHGYRRGVGVRRCAVRLLCASANSILRNMFGVRRQLYFMGPLF